MIQITQDQPVLKQENLGLEEFLARLHKNFSEFRRGLIVSVSDNGCSLLRERCYADGYDLYFDSLSDRTGIHSLRRISFDPTAHDYEKILRLQFYSVNPSRSNDAVKIFYFRDLIEFASTVIDNKWV